MPVSDYLERPNLASFPFVFVVTFGRSGSTLLQAILNSIPGYCIRGENYSSLFYLHIAAQHLAEAQRKFGMRSTTPSESWFGADQIDPTAFSEKIVDAFFDACLRPPNDARCVGFKEIRYLRPNISKEMLPDYLDFLQTAFPGAAIIFNVRNINDTSTSGWWQDRDVELVQNQLSDAIERFENYASGRSNCLMFSYDSLIANVAYGATLYEFLGEPYDQAGLKAVLDSRHGYPTVPLTENQLRTGDGTFDSGSSLSIEAAQIASLRRRLDERSVQVRSLKRKADSSEEALVRAKKALSDAQRELGRKERECSDLVKSVTSMRNSTSWRLMEPFRRLRMMQRRSTKGS